jgi:ATP-dependent helicase HrpB
LQNDFTHLYLMNVFDSHSFPVAEVLPELVRTLQQNNCCLLVAPPGAGKTTIVPPALLKADWLGAKKIIMLEPRRIAARRAAEFMAAQRGEPCGKTIGYRIRMESAVSDETKLEVVTEGVLTRLLQADAELPGTGLLIFDEYHERSIHADTGLAFALDVQKNLRPDLKILIMSATPDKEKLIAFLGELPIVESSGRMFPVTTHYLSHPRDMRIEVKTAEAVLHALRKDAGDILVFLPGKAEIKRTHHLLADALHDGPYTIHELHGGVSRAEQDAAVYPGAPGIRKIILATSIAETSLTIDGVRVVVDSGVSRISSFNLRRGMSGLVTVPVSCATAEQRRGRAGRQAAGVCYRLWTRQDEQLHPEHTPPEILTSDLTPLALELAQWGTPRAEGLAFPDPPPADVLLQSVATLHMLGAIESTGRLSELGRKMNRLPLHPRLAAMLLRAASYGMANEACLLAVLLEEGSRGILNSSFDVQDLVTDAMHRSQRNNAGGMTQLISAARKLEKLAGIQHRELKPCAAGFLLAIAYPERIAKRQADGRFQLVQGMVVSVPQESRLSEEEFLVVPEIDGAAAVGKAFSAAAISREEILSLFAEQVRVEEVVAWIDNAVRGKQKRKLGALTLQEKEFQPNDEQAAECIGEVLRKSGLSLLQMDDETLRFIERSEWCRKYAPASGAEENDWPEFTEEALLKSMHLWLFPYLAGVRRKKEIEALPVPEMLSGLFTHEQLRRLDSMAPDAIVVPSGSRIRIQYDQGEKPLLAVRLQELFGQTDTPAVGGGRIPVLIHLLSPARRPLAITQDLRSFWINTYPEVLKQMRGKYPKHVWPDDPLSAAPTNKTKRGLQK